MDSTAFAVVAAAVFAAALVQAALGVGFALIMAPILGFFAPDLLPACLLVLMLPLNVYVAWRERASLDRSGAAWITAGRLLGTFGGLGILLAVPPEKISMLIGAATIAVATATVALPPFRAGSRSFVAAGLVTGVTETATGIGGPPLALVYQHHAAAVLRSTLAFCFLVGQLISLAALAMAGRTTAAQFVTALWLVPPLAVGAIMSGRVRQHIDPRVFRGLVLAFAIAAGSVLLFRQ